MKGTKKTTQKTKIKIEKKVILLPLGTASWLLQNTKLNRNQIANFCDISLWTLEAIDTKKETAISPLKNGQLNSEEIERCEKNPTENLKNFINPDKFITKKRKYITLIQKSNKPQAIAWILKNKPGIESSKLTKMFSTRVSFIDKIRKDLLENPEYYKDSKNPVIYNFCTEKELEEIC